MRLQARISHPLPKSILLPNLVFFRKLFSRADRPCPWRHRASASERGLPSHPPRPAVHGSISEPNRALPHPEKRYIRPVLQHLLVRPH